MFCDLVGSTALSEKLDPEELRSLRMRIAPSDSSRSRELAMSGVST
jgi:hypothetical protein